MKARRKSDGEIIEVKTYMLNSRRGKDGLWESSYKDINTGLIYEASELLFNLDYYTVIQGWTARDDSGDLSVYRVKPMRNIYTKRWEGECSDIDIYNNLLFPDLTWESEPQEIEIVIKRKKNGQDM